MASSKTDKPQAPVAAQAQTLVYVGPNMGGSLPMQQFTTFRGGLPQTVQDRCDTDPAFAALLVPVAGLSAAREAIGRTGSELNRAFATVWTAYAAKRKEDK